METKKDLIENMDQLRLDKATSVLKQRKKDTDKGEDQPFFREFEKAILHFTSDFLQNTGNFGSWKRRPEEANIPTVIAHEDFSLNNPLFTTQLAEGRSDAQKEFIEIFENFTYQGLNPYKQPISDVIPTVLIQVDNPMRVAKDLGLREGLIEDVLHECQYLKAAYCLILGSKEEKHDYPGYVKKKAAELSMSILEFIKKQQLHELIELLSQPLTERGYGTYSTWYNEGVGEFLAGFGERSKVGLSKVDRPGSVEDLLTELSAINTSKTTEEADIKHAKSWLLVSAISKAYDPRDSTQGFYEFSRNLFGKQTRSGNTLEVDTMKVLQKKNLTTKVNQMIKKIFGKTVKGR